MTILEANNKLLEYFSSNEYFELSKDFSKVVLISDTDADKAAIIMALEELEKQKIVVKKVFENREYWILFKPLAFQMQSFDLSLMTAIRIANTINKFIDKEEDKVSPMRISEQDIFNLTLLASAPQKQA
jgi:hypothetical protein